MIADEGFADKYEFYLFSSPAYTFIELFINIETEGFNIWGEKQSLWKLQIK